MTEIIIILALILLNGIFSMSEAAVIASRKARLQQQADKGRSSARIALDLAESPNRFLSTVQIGITLVGILTGVFGGATVAQVIAGQIRLHLPMLTQYADSLAFGLIVALTTYFSLIIGELVPKRLALRSPESIAMLVARPMRLLSVIAGPVVSFLGASTDFVLWVLHIRPLEEAPVTQEEIQTMIQQGVEAGVFVESESTMVEGVFRLGDRRASTLMTPRTEIVWLDVNASTEEAMTSIIACEQSRYPVCDGDLDNVIGIVHARDLLVRMFERKPFDLRSAMTEPLFVPDSMPASKVLEQFRERGHEMALVIDEYGGLQGLATLQDILAEIVGDSEEEAPVERADGSWLFDGRTPVDELKETLIIDGDLPGEANFETLGGFVMAQLGRIPAAADRFDWDRLRFEVMDMDGNRVDKVLVSVLTPGESKDFTTATPEAE
jgi:putative hemolysin